MTTKIKPDREDFEAVEREHGRPSPDASDAQLAEMYRLAQAHKLIRQFGSPKAPVPLRIVP